ncbi:hypothetical protein COL26b_010239 [Colletotrichum chrysophilum]|uniref:uncharacterized protein n=1 Tax=Colletotrichum chrysophilum TaxID=1836956 RepID=UPI002300B65A|nr:uncharacterized protein COL26b_010239 [Colletotrichum chrysophilum]KAJ0370035.1 hypothetical protein COL26b_010239 [Colletotrichum chrysophilum]
MPIMKGGGGFSIGGAMGTPNAPPPITPPTAMIGCPLWPLGGEQSLHMPAFCARAAVGSNRRMSVHISSVATVDGMKQGLVRICDSRKEFRKRAFNRA